MNWLVHENLYILQSSEIALLYLKDRTKSDRASLHSKMLRKGGKCSGQMENKAASRVFIQSQERPPNGTRYGTVTWGLTPHIQLDNQVTMNKLMNDVIRHSTVLNKFRGGQ